MVKMIFLGLGATGEFPEGKLNEDDEGALKLAISNDDNMVRIDFGTPTIWLALAPEDAKRLADVIVKHADHCLSHTGKRKQ